MVELAMVASKVANYGSEASDGVADGEGRMGALATTIEAEAGHPETLART